MTSPHRNIHGRKAGRGLRPWILLPKVLAVGLYFGGLAAALLQATDATLRDTAIGALGRLFPALVVPALLGALLFGVALLLQHPRTFLRMRWLQVKLLILAIMIPTAHLHVSHTLVKLRSAAPADRSALWRDFGVSLAAVLVISAGVILLGRLKPRLAQNWARAYGATPKSSG